MSHLYIDLFSIANHTETSRQRSRTRKVGNNIPIATITTAITNNSLANVHVSNSGTL